VNYDNNEAGKYFTAFPPCHITRNKTISGTFWSHHVQGRVIFDLIE